MDPVEFEKLKLLYNQVESLTNTGTWELDLKNNQLKWSDGVFKMLGYQPQEFEITFEKGVEVIHPTDRERATKLMDDVLQNDAEYFIKKKLLSKSGNIIHVRSKANIFKDEEGNPIKLIGVFQDITEFEKSEEEIKQQNTLTLNIIKNLPSAFFLFNQKGQHLLWNKQLEEITGYDHDEIASISPEEMYEGEEKEKVKNHVKEVLKKGYTEIEAWLSTKSNGKVPIYFTASTIQYKGEKCIFGTGTDISQRLALLHELQLLINNTEEAFMYLDHELNVITYNKQMETHYEMLFQKELKKGLKLSNLAREDQKEELTKILKEVWSGNKAKAILKITADKELKHYQLKFCPIQSESKKIEGVFLTSSDVTEHIQYESALKKTNERLELVMKAGYESIWDYDVIKDELFLGEGYLKKFGFDQVKANNNIEWHDALVHPEDFHEFKSSILSALENKDDTEWEAFYRFRKKDGNYAHVKDKAVILRDENGKAIRMVGAISDVSKDFIKDKLDELEKTLMERSITSKKTIENIFKDYLIGIDRLFDGISTSIISIINNKLKNLCSPNLDEEYLLLIEDLPIGLNQGSCGTAAYLKERVIATDVMTDERWAGYRDLAKKFGIGACWSQPIFGSNGEVMATFAIYNKEAKNPQELEISVFNRAANIVSIILQNHAHIKSIEQSHDRFTFINKATNNAIYDWDIEKDHIYWGDSLTRVFGHKFNSNGFTLNDWAKMIHPDDLDEVLQSLDIFMANQKEVKWSYEYRFQDVNKDFAYVEDVGYLIRDKNGKPLRMIGALRDNTHLKQEQIKKDLQQTISLIFKKEKSLELSLKKGLKYLTEFANFSLGEIWMVSQDRDCLRLSAKYDRTQSATEFYNFDSPLKFYKDEGLPGKVWKQKNFLKWDDISSKPEFLRKEAAKVTGLESAIAYPLYFGNSITGVILFAKDSEIKNHAHEVHNFKVLEKILGEEIKRKEQEEELKLFFDSAPENLVIANQKGYFVKVNPALCNLLGYSKEELTSQPFVNFVHPDDLHTTQQVYGDIKTDNKHPEKFINRYRTKTGDYKWISWSSSSSFGPDSLVFAFGRDVTENIELQQTVENATKLARVGGWEINMLTNTHYWSPMTKEIHEVPEDFTPDLDQAVNFYHPDFQQKVSDAVEKATNNGESFDFEAIIISYKGNEKWVRAKGNAEIIDGLCVRLYGSFQDIHDRKITELRLENISNNVPGVIFQYHLKPDGTDLLDFVSKGSEEIFGFSPEECMLSTEIIWDRIEAGGDMPQMKNSILESAKNLTSWHFIWRYQHPNGKLRYHEGSGNPHKLADGTVVWDSIITDITELRELEILADRTAELAKIGSWELNLSDEKEEVYWSPMTKKILEVEADYQPSISEGLAFYTAQSRIIIEKAIKNLIETGQEFDLELLVNTKKGTEKWIRCIGQADRIKNKTSRIFGSYQDIDGQKRAELKAQETLKEKEDILESIGDAFFAVDHDWTVTYWNKEAEKLLGKKRKDILNKNLWEEYAEAINLKFYTEYHKAVDNQETVHFEEYFPPLEKWFEVSAYPSEKGLAVYFKDVTLRKTAEEKIRASNERFEKVALATSDAIWDWDLSTGQSIRFGTGFERQFGYSNEEANIKKPFWKSHVHPDDLAHTLKSQNEALADKKVNFWKEEYRFQKKSGDYAYVIDKGYIVRDKKGNAIRMIGATTDISDRKNYEKSLLDINEKLEKQAHELSISNAELEQFAYVASHDLQEPLRMVSGFLTQLEKKYGEQLDDRAHQYIDFAVDGAKRMRQIILDLLDFSRIGKEEEDFVDVDLNEVVNEVCLLHRKQIEELNAEVLFDNLPTIKGHPSPMIQLFQNLISNGLKYRHAETRPKILIKAKELKNEWKFTVKDNGIGIEEKYFERIFNIFQRLHNKTAYSGTGMGLAIVKKIVENQKGRIWLESEVGKGTTFYFTIPK
jgi:PAS domain S-box-containing protein